MIIAGEYTIPEPIPAKNIFTHLNELVLFCIILDLPINPYNIKWATYEVKNEALKYPAGFHAEYYSISPIFHKTHTHQLTQLLHR